MSARERDVDDWPGFHGHIAYVDDGDGDLPLSEDEAALMRDLLGAAGTTRRDFMKMLAATGISLPAAQLLMGCRSGAEQAGDARARAGDAQGAETVAVTLEVNGTNHQ